MKQIINVGIGQAGVQLSESLIQLYAAEHKVYFDGTRKEDTLINQHENKEVDHFRNNQNLSVMFQESQKSHLKPRFLLIDTQPEPIFEIQKSKISNLLNPNYIFHGKQSANNFGRAYYYNNQFYETNEIYENYLQKIAEKCEGLEAFILNHSICGGTGSGSMTKIMEIMSQMFPKIQKTNFIINYQKNSSNSVIDCFNASLATARILQYSDLNVLVDNHSLHQIAYKNLDIPLPNYKNANSLISQIHSSYTLQNRFSNSSLNCDIKDIQTNVCVYPRIHTVLPSFAPLIPNDYSFRWNQIYSEQLLLQKCFDKTCQLVNKGKQKSKDHKNISAILLGRGQLDITKLALAGRNIVQKQKWVSFIMTGLKMGLSQFKSTLFHQNNLDVSLKNSITCLRSSMQNAQILSAMRNSFDCLFSRRAFTHWFILDGMEQGQFSEAMQDLAALQQDFRQWDHSGCSCCNGQHQDYDSQENQPQQ